MDTSQNMNCVQYHQNMNNYGNLFKKPSVEKAQMDGITKKESHYLILEPKDPRRSISLPADGSDSSAVRRNEEFVLKLCDPTMRSTVLHRLDTFRRNRELCDVVLFVHEKEILAHKVVLAACSPALYDTFVQGEREAHSRPQTPGFKVTTGTVSTTDSSLPSPGLISPSSQPILSYYEFAQTDFDCFEAIVNYAYTSSLEISNKKVGELYKTAHALQVTSVASACAQYLIQNLNIMNCLEIRRQANINDDELVEQVDSFIASHFAEIVEKNVDFTFVTCITIRLILNSDDTKRLCFGEDFAQRALQYFQTLPHSNDRIDQWIEQLAEKSHMLYVDANTTLQDCSEMDDRSSVGASDIIQDYKRTGGYLPRTYSGSNAAETQNATHHVTGATPVNLNASRLNNTKLSSAESVSSVISTSSEAEDESHKLIAVQQTAGDFWTALTVFHGRLVTLSMQLSEVEVVAKTRTSLDGTPLPISPNQLEEEAVARLISATSSKRSALPQMCCGRCSVGAACIDGKIIVCGGYNRGECLKTVEEYDTAEGKWRLLPDMHSSRGRFDAATVDGKVYAVAGSSGSVDLKTVECFDPESEKWTMVKPLESGRSHNGCAAANEMIYCIGGCSEQVVLGDCQRYDRVVNEWTAISPLQTARYQAGCTAWHDLIVVCGGCDRWKCLESIEAFDPKTGMWRYLSPLKTARRGCAVAVVKDSLYVIGGHDGTHSLSSVEVLDHPSGQWRFGPTITTPRANIRAVVTAGGEIYLIGGFDGSEFLSSIEMFSSESLGWRSWQQEKSTTQEMSAEIAGDETRFS